MRPQPLDAADPRPARLLAHRRDPGLDQCLPFLQVRPAVRLARARGIIRGRRARRRRQPPDRRGPQTTRRPALRSPTHRSPRGGNGNFAYATIDSISSGPWQRAHAVSASTRSPRSRGQAQTLDFAFVLSESMRSKNNILAASTIGTPARTRSSKLAQPSIHRRPPQPHRAPGGSIQHRSRSSSK